MTALARIKAEKRERVLKAAVDWVYDQSCSRALMELEDAVTDFIGPEIEKADMRPAAEEKAARIVRDFINLSIAHGYPPAQTLVLERWIADALCA